MPDIANNTGTTASMGLNATFNGSLETVGDRDWVAISMRAGQAVQINLDGVGGNALEDPLVRIYDANGTSVAMNDDGGPRFNSELVFQATTAGTYYIEAASFADGDDGNYQITTAAVRPASPLDSIEWGTSIDLEVVNVYFAPNGATFDGYTSEGFNAYERAQIVEMLDNLSDVVDLEFNIVTRAGQADITLVLDLNEISNELFPFLGYFNPPGEAGEGIGVFNGDLWDRSAGGDLERGGFGYVTVVHELLHGLGMAHPHDTGGSSVVMNGVTSAFDDYGDFDLNQGVNTVMTYNSGYWTGTTGSAPASASGGDYGFEGGAMALDIAVLQELYGANTSHAGGNNTYTLANTNAGGTFWEAIWDTGGTDLIRYDGRRNATIDLREATLEYGSGGGGFVSAANGVRGGFTIANDVVIENARGGSGADRLVGNDVANFLVGAAGNDRIYGYNGHDRLVGGNGNDRLYGNNGNDRMDGNNGNDAMSGGNGNDIMNGGAGDDRLFGGNGADRISGLDGDDRLYGNNGNDRIYGAEGRDRLLGQNGDDRLVGGTGSDRFFGGEGRDVMIGGGGRDGFVFIDVNDSAVGAQRDQINDFDSRYDVINLRVIDANENANGNQEFDYIGGAAFSGTAGEVRFADLGANVIVSGDVDGDGVADFEIMLLGTGTMEANDFLL